MRSTWVRALLTAALLAAASAHAFPARVSVRDSYTGQKTPPPVAYVTATLTGLLPPCHAIGETTVRTEPRLLVMTYVYPLPCPAVLLPLPWTPVRVSVDLAVSNGERLVSWVDGFPGSPIGHQLDAIRSFGVRDYRVMTNARAMNANFYRGFLGREPDPGGADYWAGVAETLVERGFADHDISLLLSRTFVASGELHASGLPNAEFVRRMYVGYLGREPDAGGLAFWTGALEAGLPRDWLTATFMHSQEFAALATANSDPSPATRPDVQLIGDVFRATVGRPPSDQEHAAALAPFRALPCQAVDKPALASAAVEGFVSLRFDALGGITHDEYVVALYDAILRRAPDPGGLEYWSGLLEGGFATREQVRTAFLQSGVFRARVDAITAADCVAPS